ncbi:unnamed protein product [Pleuronectes platessa]|uniref:Uncharacterized protein n=1 Tax=Pleuronectes platessa TaxID=8262 RepID=A0A9N7U4S8_PLEPL|nr:unnamed protein product [Pleuronectes platessa]
MIHGQLPPRPRLQAIEKRRHRQRIHFERGTQNVEATPEHRANPYRPGAWLFTTDTEATLNRRAALIISPVDPVDRCTAFVPVTPEAEAPRCAKAASRCFSLRCDRHKVLTWEWMGASCYLRLGAALKRPV